MGCASSTANNKGKDEMGKRKLPVEASTVVKRLIENEFYRDELREFILLRWCPSKCDSQYFRSNAREIALSCLDFWLDSKDFVKINCRIFQEYRACIIFEKYIMHGALQQIPIGSNLVDDCTKALFGKDSDFDYRMFELAECEAFDFLIAEVYPDFSQTECTRNYRKKETDLFHQNAVSGSNPKYATATNETLNKCLDKILSDKEAFKGFLKRTQNEKSFYCFIESLDFSLKLSELSATCEAEMRQLIFLHYFNMFYENYLSIGAPFRVDLSAAVYGDIACRISNEKLCKSEVLNPLTQELKRRLISNYIPLFLETTEYQYLIRVGRKSIAFLLNCSQVVPVSTFGPVFDSVIEEKEDESEPSSCLQTSKNASRNRELNKRISLNGGRGRSVGIHDNTEIMSKELTSFLRTGYNLIFGRFLAMCESQSLMLFYQSATRYQEAQYLHDGERIYECAMIYGRYICRNSNDFVALPENLRKSITKNLFKGSQEIFSDAIGWVLETMVTQYWQEFKTTVFAQRKSEDVLTTINNDDSGLNGRLETQDEELNTQYSVDSSQNSLNSHFQTNTDASATKRKSVTSFNPFQFNVILGKGDVTSSMSDFASMAAKRFPPLENNTLSLESSTDEISRPYLTLTGKEIRQSLQHIMSSSGNRFSSFHNIYSPVSSRTVISHSTVCSSVEEVKLNPSTNTVLRRRSVRKNSIGAPTIAGNKSFSGVLSNTIGQTFQKREKCRKKSDLCFPLQIILDHPQCCSILKEHLDREGLSQTLLFFEEIAEFRRIPSYDYMIFRARKIFNIYIHDMAVSPLPVTCEVREKIRKDIEEANIKPTMFVIAYNEVVEYIERFLYPRFQNSSDMRRVVAMLNIQNSINGIIRKHSSMSVDANVVRNVNTLRDILRYQYATKFLKDFCSRTLCSENVLFWLDAENYANLPGSDYMKRVAQKIFKKYIEDESTMQINVSYSTKREIMTNLDRSSRGLFKKAQEEVYKLMEYDTFKKFIKAPEYKALCLSVV